MIDPASQLARFTAATELLGGSRSAARVLGVNERHLRRILAGTAPLHAGFLADIAAALLAHADACRAAERQLSPAFADNLTGPQRDRPAHGNAYHLRGPASEGRH